MGLCVVAASTMGFGHAHSVAGLLVSRGVQGCGMALTAVSCMSLLLAQSPNVTADMGLQVRKPPPPTRASTPRAFGLTCLCVCV